LRAAVTGGSVRIKAPLVSPEFSGTSFDGGINGGGDTTVNISASGGNIVVAT
jgi:hypothetical protein